MSGSASNPSLSPSPAGGSSSGGGSSSNGNGGGSNGNGGNCDGGTVTIHPSGPCGACKFLRRKCHLGCIFAPYFDADQGAAYFAAVHKVFGASNVSKLLQQIPHQRRLDAVVTICYEAQARLKDPVYGIVSQIFGLQQQVVNLQSELTYLQGHLTQLQLSPPIQPPPPPPQPPLMVVPPPLTISDLPSPSSVPANYDLSSLFDQMGSQSSASWAMQPPYQANDPRLYGRGGGGSSTFSGGHHDLQTIAQEFMNCQCNSHHLSPSSSVPRTEASPSSSSPGHSG